MPSVLPITSLPTFVSPEEHSSILASTPTSFSDIPPVLKHKEENITVILDPPHPDFTNADLKGTLYVLTSVLVFLSDSGRGFKVEYPSITLHAVSRGESGPSIYCQLDDSTADQNAAQEEQFTDMTELNLVPNNLESLESIFEALSLCASLHPDEINDDEDDLDDAFIDASTANFETFNGDEDEELSEVGRAALAHLESIIYDPFEDAEEDVEEVVTGATQNSSN